MTPMSYHRLPRQGSAPILTTGAIKTSDGVTETQRRHE